MQFLNFTPTERELLMHRLDVGDCLADALTDKAEGDPAAPWTWEEVDARAGWLGEFVRRTGGVTVDALTDLDRAILKDAVEGNTALCDLEVATDLGDVTKGRAATLRKAARTIVEKLAGIGIECDPMPVM